MSNVQHSGYYFAPPSHWPVVGSVALFFMAFLPQFVDSAADSRVPAFLFLGAVFIFNGTVWCLILVLGASAMSRRLRASPSMGVHLRRVTGVMFIGLGARLATSR